MFIYKDHAVMHKQNRDPTVAGLENSKNVYTQIINIYTILWKNFESTGMSITFDNWIHTLCRVRAKSNKKQQKTQKEPRKNKNNKQNRRKRLVHVGELFHNLYQYTFFPIMAPPSHPSPTFSPYTSPGPIFDYDEIYIIYPLLPYKIHIDWSYLCSLFFCVISICNIE